MGACRGEIESSPSRSHIPRGRRGARAREFQAALAEVQTLQAILPICSYCRKIRDDENYWHTVEGYIGTHTTSKFSHGICPECLATRVEAL